VTKIKDLTKLEEQQATTNSRFRGVLTIHSLHSVRRWRTSALIWNKHNTRHCSSCDQIICDVSVSYYAAAGNCDPNGAL